MEKHTYTRQALELALGSSTSGEQWQEYCEWLDRTANEWIADNK
jgi:hypothetical protein